MMRAMICCLALVAFAPAVRAGELDRDGVKAKPALVAAAGATAKAPAGSEMDKESPQDAYRWHGGWGGWGYRGYGHWGGWGGWGYRGYGGWGGWGYRGLGWGGWGYRGLGWGGYYPAGFYYPGFYSSYYWNWYTPAYYPVGWWGLWL